MLTVLDLFSGIGGFSLGLERTGGFKTAAFCEIDPFCRKVLHKHWLGVPIHKDVRTIDHGYADVIAAGWPCQDISNAGERTGLAGARSGLWREVVRAIRLVRPRYAILENVAALLVRGMERVLGDLAESGADAEWDSLPTCLPLGHRRERTFIVADIMRAGLPLWRDADPEPGYAPSIFTRERFAGVLAPAIPLEKWSDRPLLERGISRIPNRTQRVAGCGNSVNPQVVELIGNAILDTAPTLR